ncbi:MAG TPA: hypothetical protein VGJ91_09090 [Polyangiaceae bacterium]|jgi:hypothetical protein
MSRGSLPPLEDDFSRALLGSAESDAPSNAAYAKAAAALGIGVGLGVGASLPAPAAVALGAASAAGVARWSSSLGAKLLALGLSGAAIVGAGALLWSTQLSNPAARIEATPASRAAPAAKAGLESARTPASPAAAHQPAVPSLGSRSVVPSGSPASPPSSASSPSASDVQGAPSPALRPLTGALSAQRARRINHALSGSAVSARASAPRGSTGSSLAEQVQSLDRARVALGSGDSSAALREIAHYRAAWPDGVFLTEASVLEIEALAARGDQSQARARAADFVEAHPDSPQADRLRALIPAKKR